MSENSIQRSSLLGVLLVAFFLFGCAEGGTPREGGFEGLGQGHVTAVEGVVKGKVLFKGFHGEPIILEARSTFPCVYGRCPVIERDPLGQERLDGPGPFSLPLTEIEENIIIIATSVSSSGSLRVAHHLIPNPQSSNDGLELSLDRPHPPLR